VRRAANFNPEWGYLAPAPSFLRTLRMIAVAAAVGATAGAAVVLSLVDRPAAEESVAARTLAVEPVAVLAAPAAAQSPVQEERQPQSAAISPARVRPGVPDAADSATFSTISRPAGVAVLAESPPATDAAPVHVVTARNGTLLQNNMVRKPQLGWRSPTPSGATIHGPLMLLRSPIARATTGANPPRVVN
jgi:hypothetical protein